MIRPLSVAAAAAAADAADVAADTAAADANDDDDDARRLDEHAIACTHQPLLPLAWHHRAGGRGRSRVICQLADRARTAKRPGGLQRRVRVGLPPPTAATWAWSTLPHALGQQVELSPCSQMAAGAIVLMIANAMASNATRSMMAVAAPFLQLLLLRRWRRRRQSQS